MFLLHSRIQKTSGVIGPIRPAFSRTVSLLSDNQPCLQQTTLPIRQPRGYIGQVSSFRNTIARRQLSVTTVVVPPSQRQLAGTAVEIAHFSRKNSVTVWNKDQWIAAVAAAAVPTAAALYCK